MTDPLRHLLESFARILTPPPDLSLADWCAEHMRLSRESSAVPGKFEAWPFQLEPMHVMSPSHPAEKIALLCGSQTMKTQLLLNFIAYAIAHDPGPILLVEPTEDDADSFSKDRVTPMLRDVEALRGLVAEAKSRDAGNTIGHKTFAGGSLNIVYATSPSKLAMRPIRYLLMDEVSRYGSSAGKEGDPVALAEKRTVTFWNRKMVYASSPGNDGHCRITDAFTFSDQRQWQVPCPFCSYFQTLEWAGIAYSAPGTSAESPHYRCAGCEKLIPHGAKHEMNAGGRWVAMNPGGRYPGFRLNGLVSPVRSWADIVHEWLGAQGRPEQLKVFTNTVLAETWKEPGEAAPDWEILRGRAESYRQAEVPAGVMFLTAGIDVQKDRCEMAVWGWGENRERWLVDYVTIPGKIEDDTTKSALSAAIDTKYTHPAGLELSLLRVAIDSGHESTQVYEWARRNPGRVMVIKGFDGGVALVGQPTAADTRVDGRIERRGVRVWPVNVSMAKSELYGLLKLARPEAGQPFPAGWVHFYDAGDEFFKQLTAESWQIRLNKGFRKGYWEKNRPNEALDTANYARAAAAIVGVDRFGAQQWAAFRRQIWGDVTPPALVATDQPEAAVPATPAAVQPRQPAPRRPRVIRSSWMG